MIAFELVDVKLESSKVYLLKLGENLSWDFEVIYIFPKNFGSKYMPISQRFLSVQENK